MKKGQVFTWDMIFGTILFMTILVIVAYLWDSTIKEIKDAEKIYDIGWQATMSSESLVRTPGSPETWEQTLTSIAPGVWDFSEVEMFGLADTQQLIGVTNIQDRLISPDKTLWFMRMGSADYEEARAHTLRSGKYDFYIQIKCKDGGTDCFTNLHAPSIGTGFIECKNKFNISIVNNWTVAVEDPGDQRCILGNYTTPGDAGFITSSTKHAVFNEPLNMSDISWAVSRSFNKAVEIKVVVYEKPTF
ncbi:MAG: hypothetical protein ABH834_06360 [Candidatus Altiarchaeota archaeon]